MRSAAKAALIGLVGLVLCLAGAVAALLVAPTGTSGSKPAPASVPTEVIVEIEHTPTELLEPTPTPTSIPTPTLTPTPMPIPTPTAPPTTIPGSVTGDAYATPISLDRNAGHFPDPYFIISLVEDSVHLAMVDDQGRAIGIMEDGSFVAEIPGSAPIFGLDREAFVLPADEGQHYVAKLRGYETGTYSYYQFQRGGVYHIEEASALPTTVDEVDISAEGDRMAYSTNDTSKTFSATIYRQTLDFTRVFTTANTSLAAGEVVTFEVSPDLATFKYLNPGGPKTYDLGLEQAGVYSGTVSFDGLQIGANEAHIITAEDWDRLETTRITLSIDRGNDGTIEEVVILQPG